MRSLGTIASLRNINPSIKLSLVSRDGLTTYVHCVDDFLSMTPIEWEIPFTGGLGKPSGYDVTLSMDLDTIKARLPDYNRAIARLTVDVSSTPFQPHVGRVRSMQRSDADPNALTLKIIDRFLDDNPLVPEQTIISSYPNTHPREQDADIAVPLYYGRHHRPFYHTATDCSITVLEGPRNVSSLHHTNSNDTWFNTDFSKGDDIAGDNMLLVKKYWDQQSDSSNTVKSFAGIPFEIGDGNGVTGRFWEFNGNIAPVSNWAGFLWTETQAEVHYTSDGLAVGQPSTQQFSSAAEGIYACLWDFKPYVSLKSVKEIFQVTKISASAKFAGITLPDSFLCTIRTHAGSGGGFYINVIATTTDSWGVDVLNYNATGGNAKYMMSPRGKSYFDFYVYINSTSPISPTYPNTADHITATMSVSMFAQLKSESYKRYSIFTTVTRSADVACVGSCSPTVASPFENPIGILDHVFSYHTATPYRQDQSSAAQANVTSISLQCFFAIRTPLNKIVDEFGRISATYAWIGDSGSMNYRTYQESATATVNRTLTVDDYISLQPIESPLGSSITEQDFARDITVEYGYHFQRAAYEKTIHANNTNNALCNSANAAGITQGRIEKTQYITNPNVASYYLGNLVRKYAQGNEFVRFRGAANLFDLELADVVNVQNPILVGSEGLYQVIKASMHPLEGWAEFTAAKLLSLNP